MYNYDYFTEALKARGVEHNYNGKNDTKRDLTEVSGWIPDHYNNPSRHICSHMEFLKANYSHRFIGPKIGLAFEYIVVDAMLNFVNNKMKLINIDSVFVGKESVRRLGVPSKYSVDVDFLINDNYAFFLKTSLRERWKQWERDGQIIDEEVDRNVNKVFLFFREQDDTTPAESIAAANKAQAKLRIDAKLLSVYDEQGMYDLCASMMGKVKGAY